MLACWGVQEVQGVLGGMLLGVQGGLEASSVQLLSKPRWATGSAASPRRHAPFPVVVLSATPEACSPSCHNHRRNKAEIGAAVWNVLMYSMSAHVPRLPLGADVKQVIGELDELAAVPRMNYSA